MLFLVVLMYILLHLVEVSDEVSVCTSSQSLLIIHLQFFSLIFCIPAQMAQW